MFLNFIYFILKGQELKEATEDGLFNRFLIAIAYKHRPNRETAEANDKIPKLGHLFFLTKKTSSKY